MIRSTLYSVFFLLVLFFSVGRKGVAQQEKKVIWHSVPAGITVSGKTADHLMLKIHFSGVTFREVIHGEGHYLRMKHPGLTSSYREGLPDLPVLRKLIDVPPGASVSVEKVTWKTYQVPLEKKFPGTKLFPAQPSVLKSGDEPPPLFKMHKNAYIRNAFFGDSLVRITRAGILRGHDLRYLTIAPFGYNPVNNVLDVKDDIELTLRFSRPYNTADTYKSKSLYSPVFQQTYDKILAVKSTETKGTPTAPLKYVILTDSMFSNELKDFIRWKTQQGYKVEVVYKGAPDVGTTAESIKNYLKSLYDAATPDDPAPTFLLIVGDTDQIPPSASSGQVTDLYYATYDNDSDYIPDVYYGRFSARDSAELMPQLEKTLEYEKYLFPDPSFLNEAVMVAGVDGSYASVWGNGQINYATENYVNTAHDYLSHTYLYPASGSSDAQIIQDISNGVSLVNYTGHGRPDRWEDPTFTLSDIATLQNAHKYPLVITNGCSTGAFGNAECFAEAMLRAPDKGAVGYIGCSNDSYWDEDYYWSVGVGPIVSHPAYEETSLAMYDRLFHDHGEPGQDWYITQDQMIFAGNMAVMEGSPSRAQYYWEIYHLFGDPSLMIYLSEPDSLTLLVPKTLPLNLSSLNIITEPGTYIGLTYKDTLLDAVTADQYGSPVLNFPSLKDTGYLVITATRQNRIPVVDTLNIVSDQDPYLQVHEITLDDSTANANGRAENGENIFLDIRIRNTGKTGAGSLSGILSAYSPWVDVTDSTMQIDTLAPENDKLVHHACRIHVHDSIPDQQMVAFRVKLADDKGHQWDSYFTLMIYAPVLKVERLIIDDKKKGNGNARLEAGEQVVFSVEVQNMGHAVTKESYALVSLTESLVSQYQDSAIIGKIDTMSKVSVPFTVDIDSAAPYGSLLAIRVEAHEGPYRAVDTFTAPIGLSFEDFESGNFLGFPWQYEPDHPWLITDKTAWHGIYSAVSADIGDNAKSSLSLPVEASQDDSVSFYYRVSSEQDWDFLKFYIDGVEKGKWSGELPWTYVSFPVDSGSHAFTWTYMKDGNTSKGLDCAWLDYVIFPKYSFTKLNAGVIKVLSPKSGPDLGNEEPLTVVVKNFGTDDLDQIPLLYQVNDHQPVRDTLVRTLVSGDTAHFTFASLLHLRVIKKYHLFVSTGLPGDQVPVNDGFITEIDHEGTIDIVVDSLVSPSPDSLYGASEHIEVNVINASSGAVDTFPLHYRINDNPVVSYSLDTIVNAGDTLLFYFPQQVNMADTGTYHITVYASVPGDVIVSNDTLTASLYNKIQGKNKLHFTRSITLYPNPTGDFLFIRLSSGKTEDTYQLAIFDMHGKKVMERPEIKNQGEQVIGISVNQLPPGTYLLLLFNNQEKIPVPFVKK